MTLSEFIEELQDIQDERGDVEVRIAHQPSWPLRCSVHSIKWTEGKVWVVASSGHPYGEDPYADKRLWDEEFDEDEEDDDA